MYAFEPITLERDCEALLIPSGDPITLEAGSVVFLIQALGGFYTVNINGNLARIAGQDADALGLEPEGPEAEASMVEGPVDESQLWEVLSTCYDPEIPINIVDLGLIYDLKITPQEAGGSGVDIKMTLTAPGCGMGAILVEDVRYKVERIPHVTQANVELVFDPPWNPSMMSEAARLQAGLY